MSKAKPSSLEIAFMRNWKLIAGDKWPFPTREFRFHPKRMWRFDFAWEAERVAVEMEGGARSHPVRCNHCRQLVERPYKKGSPKMVQVYASMGGHMSMKGFQNDCEKYREAQLLGWRVLSYTAADIQSGPVQMVEQIASLLAQGPKVDVETQTELFGAPDAHGETEKPF